MGSNGNISDIIDGMRSPLELWSVLDAFVLMGDTREAVTPEE